MSVAALAAALACVIFAAGMFHAAVTDLRCRRIRNWLVVALGASWAPLALVAGIPPTVMAGSLLAAALVFAAGFGCFAAGWLGGGDVKLGAVAVLWLGAGQAVDFLLLTAALGAGLGLPLLVFGRIARSTPPRAGRAGVQPSGSQGAWSTEPRPMVVRSTGSRTSGARSPESGAGPRELPYGPALGIAALVLLQGSPWAAAFQ